MPQANCKGCERRYVGCHARCEIYQEYRKKQDAYLKAKNLYREAEALEVSRTLMFGVPNVADVSCGRR